MSKWNWDRRKDLGMTMDNQIKFLLVKDYMADRMARINTAISKESIKAERENDIKTYSTRSKL